MWLDVPGQGFNRLPKNGVMRRFFFPILMGSEKEWDCLMRARRSSILSTGIIGRAFRTAWEAQSFSAFTSR
jgi:hypothetical protein